ncbi:MAG: hypothetical protein ABSG49_02435 [Methanoregula sp.]|jgi:metal-responsive CopG/Arc/MetJ family transcriptional regulator|uniref:hypothetical protein n=1 Tax=Methanoregula sp. TaxID=2052170 RepID=UPI003C1434F0
MTREEVTVSLRMPILLIEKLDTIAKQKYLNRADVIIDACTYYCQFHDKKNEPIPETTRDILFNLARHDGEFRDTLRGVFREDLNADSKNRK